MKKLVGYVNNVAKCLLFLGFCVQIGFGLIWTFQNIGKKTLFAEMQVGSLNEYYIAVYVVQLLCAFGTYYAFLKVMRNGKDSNRLYVFGAMVLLTIPSVLQCHLAVLPYSFMSTVLVVWFTLLIWWLRKKGSRARYAVGTVLSVLVVFVICMVPVWINVETAVSKQNSVLVSLTSRIVQPFILTDSYIYPLEIKQYLSQQDVRSVVVTSDGMASQFYPSVLSEHGEAVANELCIRLIQYELGFNTRKIVEYIVQDFTSYHAPAVANYMHLEGMGYASMASRNYACLSMHSPAIASWYVTYWAVSFLLFVVSTIVIWVAEKRKMIWRYVILIGVPIECAIVLFTMQGAGLMDYKKVLFATLMTYSVMLLALFPKTDGDREGRIMNGKGNSL